MILFFTGNATNGSFAVAEKTVMDRCGMSEETYKKARKALVEKGWLIHNPGTKERAGEIIVDYDAIYKSAQGQLEDTPSSKIEDSPMHSEYPPSGDIENTHNNIIENIKKDNSDIIKIQETKKVIDFCETQDGFVF
ncbi:MAG: hypothetical protein IJA31_12570 [Clostridia bacterium]|nr:hypothetical protein [Clostridia bacterium]